jgi:hypothetical protein
MIRTDTMKWFGTHWGAPVCDELPHVATPVGTLCIHCEEAVEEKDSGIIYAGGSTPAHIECFMRGIAGSVAHQEKRCSCYVHGADEGDPPGMTKREAARAAYSLFQRRVPYIYQASKKIM